MEMGDGNFNSREGSCTRRPVLASYVAERQTARLARLRVFCPVERASIGVESCTKCSECAAIKRGVQRRATHVYCRAATPGADEAHVGLLVGEGIVSVHEESTLCDLIEVLAVNGLGSIPVVNSDGHHVGTLSESTVLLEAVREAMATEAGRQRLGKVLAGLKARDIMDPPISVLEGATVARAREQLRSVEAVSVPVTTSEGFPMGLVDTQSLRTTYEDEEIARSADHAAPAEEARKARDRPSGSYATCPVEVEEDFAESA